MLAFVPAWIYAFPAVMCRSFMCVGYTWCGSRCHSYYCEWPLPWRGQLLPNSASEMTYIVSSGALNSTHSLTQADKDRPTYRKCQTPSKRRTDGGTDGQRDTHGLSASTTSTTIAAVTPCQRLCDSSTVSKANGRTNERTDSRNRIWRILALKCVIWWQ